MFHENKAFRKILRKHSDDPNWFLERYPVYKNSSIKARSYLAEVMEHCQSHFKENLVDFTFITFK